MNALKALEILDVMTQPQAAARATRKDYRLADEAIATLAEFVHANSKAGSADELSIPQPRQPFPVPPATQEPGAV